MSVLLILISFESWAGKSVAVVKSRKPSSLCFANGRDKSAMTLAEKSDYVGCLQNELEEIYDILSTESIKYASELTLVLGDEVKAGKKLSRSNDLRIRLALIKASMGQVDTQLTRKLMTGGQ